MSDPLERVSQVAADMAEARHTLRARDHPSPFAEPHAHDYWVTFFQLIAYGRRLHLDEGLEAAEVGALALEIMDGSEHIKFTPYQGYGNRRWRSGRTLHDKAGEAVKSLIEGSDDPNLTKGRYRVFCDGLIAYHQLDMAGIFRDDSRVTYHMEGGVLRGMAPHRPDNLLSRIYLA